MSVAERLGYVSRASSKSLVDIFVEMPFNSHVIGSLPSRKASDGLGSTGHLNRPEWEVIFPLVRTWQPAAKSRFLKFLVEIGVSTWSVLPSCGAVYITATSRGDWTMVV